MSRHPRAPWSRPATPTARVMHWWRGRADSAGRRGSTSSMLGSRGPSTAVLVHLVVVVLVVAAATGGAWSWLRPLDPAVVSLAPLAADDENSDDESSDGDQDDEGNQDDEGESGSEDDADQDQGGQDDEGDQGNADQEQQDQQEQGQEDDGNEEGSGDDGGDEAEQGEFEGRDDIGEAGDDEYVAINQVESNSGLGEGGDFAGGSYTVECSLADHKNSDNPIIAPGVRNGAQHMHDYAGNESTNANSDSDTLGAADTTCTNGDQTPLFWPVLRDLNGTGPDVGQDGGSLDGNVGSYVDPSSIGITFHGHGSREIEPMPRNLILSVGAAKAATADGEGSNAKYSCSGFEDRVTDQYPVCPQGSELQRIYDFPSCWDGENLDSEDHTTHLVFPDKDGECATDEVPVPALRMTIAYDDMPAGRSFAIDSFPEQQHDPITDHALAEYITSERRAEAGAACINSGRDCTQGSESAARGSLALEDQQPRPLNFGKALSTHARAHGLGGPDHAGPSPTGSESGAAAHGHVGHP